MGYIFFPLTPTLSPGERENRPPFLGHSRDGVCQGRVRRTRAWRRLSPLPEGEYLFSEMSARANGARTLVRRNVST